MGARAFAILAFLLAGLPALATVTPLPGVTPQRAFATAAFPTAIAVKVTDASGLPVVGATVAYSDSQGGTRALDEPNADCSVQFMLVYTCERTTNAEGIATFPRMKSLFAGTFHPTLVVSQGPGLLGQAVLELVADPLQAPVSLSIVSGNGQVAVQGTALAPIVARVQAPDGSPRAGAIVYYQPTSTGPGGFELQLNGPNQVVTDASGRATLPRFTAGWGLGAWQAQVRTFDAAAAAWVDASIDYQVTNAQGGSTLSLGDLWWVGPAESGWGVSVLQHQDRLFNVWFVYDEQGRPTWFVQSGGAWIGGLGSAFEGPLYHPRGSPWHAYDASRFSVGAQVGRGMMDFRGTESAWTSLYAATTQWLEGFTKPVVRQPFGRSTAAPIAGVGDLWWGGPAQNGWGLAIHEQAGTLFMVWFTYGDDGRPTWFVMPGGQWTASGSYAGTVYRTRGPSFTLEAFDPSKVTTTDVGTFELRFASKTQARLDAVVENTRVVLDLVRQPF